jgi:hypothetical protein
MSVSSLRRLENTIIHDYALGMLLDALNSLSTTWTIVRLVSASTSAPIYPAVQARSSWVQAGVQYQAYSY